jgi:probable HAF family extracellular repeat protein
MVDLGTLGGNSSQAVAVNNRGQVVGQSTAVDGSVRAFLWTEADGMMDLGTLGGTTSIASAVNDRGQVVGSSGRADRSVHAFSWTKAEGMVDLGTLAGTNESLARAVNNRGRVVGESYLTDPEVARAFSLTGQPPAKGNDRRRRRLVNLGTIGGTFSSAAAVNEHGQIVGSSALTDTNDPDFAGVFHAFSWTEAGGIVDLGTLGDMNSFAIAINDKGQVVGSSYVPGGSLSRALLWNTKQR